MATGDLENGDDAPGLRASALAATGYGDVAFRALATLAAALILLLALLILYELLTGALPALQAFGLGFLGSTTWDPAHDRFGALPFLAGTLITSAVALLFALPLSLGIAVLLAEYVPGRLRDPLTFVVELLAAIPSVVFGLWGLYVVAPILQNTVDPAIAASPLGLLPIFGEPGLGYNLFTASVVLAIMVVPIITSLSKEVLLQVPRDQREAGMALGLTRWETVRRVVLPYGRAGIFSATVLGLGRALGETMAVTMLIGNTPQLTFDLFKSGYTMSSLLANQFNESVTRLHTASLFEIGLLLFLLSFVVNGLGRLLVRQLTHAGRGG